MSTTARPRLLRATAVAFAITASALTTVSCGSDVVDDGVEQEVEEETGGGEEQEDD